VYLGEPSFDLQVMPDHANSFADRRSADVLSCSVFVAICDRGAQEFGPSPCVSSPDSIDLRNHHIWFTLPQWNYKSRLVICTPARLIELNKPPSFFLPSRAYRWKREIGSGNIQESECKSLQHELRNERQKNTADKTFPDLFVV